MRQNHSELDGAEISYRALDKSVAVLCMWYGHNYGAVMTSYALYKLLCDLGYYPSLVNHTGHSSIPCVYRDKNNSFRRFFEDKEICITKQLSCAEDFQELNNNFGIFLVGSDQLWRYRYTKRLGLFYYLDFVAPSKKRIAFGTSFGTNPCEAPQDFRDKASLLLSMFSGVSSRERDGVSVLEKQYHTKADFVLDPVFLCDKKHYEECALQSRRDAPKQGFILSYILDPKPEYQDIIHAVASSENAEIINLLDAYTFEQTRNIMYRIKPVENPTPDDWMFYMMNSKHVVTDSFHGLCFAIIFNKPFTVIANEKRGLSRFKSLLAEFGLEDYLMSGVDDFERVKQLPEVSWANVNERLSELKNQSITWLKHKLAEEPSSVNIPISHICKRIQSLESENTYMKAWLCVLYQSEYKKIVRRLKLRYFMYLLLHRVTWGTRKRKYEESAMCLRKQISEIRTKYKEYSLIADANPFLTMQETK